jgi:hypothetical protein
MKSARPQELEEMAAKLLEMKMRISGSLQGKALTTA